MNHNANIRWKSVPRLQTNSEHQFGYVYPQRITLNDNDFVLSTSYLKAYYENETHYINLYQRKMKNHKQHLYYYLLKSEEETQAYENYLLAENSPFKLVITDNSMSIEQVRN